MDNDSPLRQEHHRRPRSIGGTSKAANISYLEEQDHRDWHTIVGNMNAFQTSNLLNKLKYIPENVMLVCKFINGSEVKGRDYITPRINTRLMLLGKICLRIGNS